MSITLQPKKGGRKEFLMPTKQGDLALLNDPVAQAPSYDRPCQRASPTIGVMVRHRVVPIGFHWNGAEIVLGTPPDAPKMKALRDAGDRVALTIDSDTMPHKVLLIRGTIRIDLVDGIAPEYAAISKRVFGEEGGVAWLAQLAPVCPRMSRIFIKPTWVGILDFESRFPSALERAMAGGGSLPTTEDKFRWNAILTKQRVMRMPT